MASPLTSDSAKFVQQVSAATGIDPRVLIAWVGQENADAPGGTGGYNYLNLRPYKGDPYSSVSSGGFEQFSTVDAAVIATVRRIQQPFAAPIVASARAKQDPRQEIAAIASTGWDQSHYGGAGGPNLLNKFTSLFSAAGADSPYVSPTNALAITNTVGTGSAADAGSTDLGTAPGTKQLIGGAKTAYNDALAIPHALGFLFSYRGLEVIGGGILVIVAVIALLREVGISAPGPRIPWAGAPQTKDANSHIFGVSPGYGS